jgi:hypothetical protein
MENFVFNKELSRYEGTIPSSEIVLTVQAKEGELGNFLLEVNKLITSITTSLPIIKEQVVKKMHKIAVEWQLQNNESREITKEEFLSELELHTIDVIPRLDLKGTLWFHVGDIFLGHDIEVRISKDMKINEIVLAG